LSEHEVAQRLFHLPLLADSNVVLFEDARTEEELFPLAVLRPSWEIRCGAGSLRRWMAGLKMPGMTLMLRPRNHLKGMSDLLSQRKDDSYDAEQETVFLNGRLLALWKVESLADDLPETVTDDAGRVLIARRKGPEVMKLLSLSGNDLASYLVQESKHEKLPDGWQVIYARYPWDYMLHQPVILPRQLTLDNRTSTELLGAHFMRELPSGIGLTDKGANGHPVYIAPGAKLMPDVVFGNHAGPIWIGPQTEIEPQSYLEGPLYIGPNCRVKSGSRFYHGCSLGPHCRVAGELSASILQSFVNKQHEGFLGNSHLSQWINLGADTRTSNLRNDYSEVKVQIGEKLIPTGEMFLGVMAGDHTKTGINTMFNAGTVVGIGANVYGAGYPPRFIHSFSWGGAEGFKPESLDRTLATARFAMSRRGQELADAEEVLLRKHYAETVNMETRS
jgi:UDP-N-acetylglucosamine diphosphorylase / glucose-1-phosphate thymidylyltransferase / UDP-N-acetylgalactosamine diphosphorylase / glucosamine-1-phosphate N-acetyltransferase / galactosamine-1-phosphate N-acetyltransferase